jgi:hypothetical protein
LCGLTVIYLCAQGMDYVVVAAPSPHVNVGPGASASSSDHIDGCARLTTADGQLYYMQLATGR